MRDINSGKIGDRKDYWVVVKKAGKAKKDIRVVLGKKEEKGNLDRGEKWFVKVDGGPEKIVNQVQDIMKEIIKKHPEVKINTFK